MRSFSSIYKFVLAAVLMLVPAASFAGVIISVNSAPPALPVYTQPLCPGDGYLWTPGYWAYGPAGYYWVPGVWVRPPAVGVLWTPGYWGFSSGAYIFHAGYWGPHVGFYGGVNYGFGYGGAGYEGGYWRNGAFAYNRTVNNINVTNV
ncbi:MAG TPA: YXWGXW repeat-containing protein, partial [Edaphobacter sp.]|nr:YXWGXW repeat-containing protein [Edaphobacter sp.]